MKTYLSLAAFVLAISAFLASGCSSFDLTQSGPDKITDKAVIQPVVSADEDVSVGADPIGPRPRDREEFEPLIRSMIARRDYKGLDEFAANLRDKKERFEKGGGWKIHSLISVAALPKATAETDWSRHISLLQE